MSGAKIIRGLHEAIEHARSGDDDDEDDVALALNMGSCWRNNKTGRLYYVISVANHSETGELLVVYHPVDVPSYVQLWARPKALFLEKFTYQVTRD